MCVLRVQLEGCWHLEVWQRPRTEHQQGSIGAWVSSIPKLSVSNPVRSVAEKHCLPCCCETWLHQQHLSWELDDHKASLLDSAGLLPKNDSMHTAHGCVCSSRSRIPIQNDLLLVRLQFAVHIKALNSPPPFNHSCERPHYSGRHITPSFGIQRSLG